jgi:hypothetical protein
MLGLPKSGVSILRNSYFSSLGMCHENYSYTSESWAYIPYAGREFVFRVGGDSDDSSGDSSDSSGGDKE